MLNVMRALSNYPAIIEYNNIGTGYTCPMELVKYDVFDANK